LPVAVLATPDIKDTDPRSPSQPQTGTGRRTDAPFTSPAASSRGAPPAGPPAGGSRPRQPNAARAGRHRSRQPRRLQPD